jgi:antitoxin PrlF
VGMPVTIKGQVTIPKAIRDRLGIRPGVSTVEFDIVGDGQVMLRRTETEAPAADRFARVRGKPPKGWNGMTTEEVMRMTRGDDWGDPG